MSLTVAGAFSVGRCSCVGREVVQPIVAISRSRDTRSPMDVPRTRYARNGPVHLAYQVSRGARALKGVPGEWELFAAS